jgi:3-deoxy-D-manno-octulosonate 8-phosphate phosphatase KdsC-like HAD superfamily phosphatase
MAEVGLSIAVADAHPLLLPRADYVTRINGGRGRYAKSAICYYWRRASWMRPKGNQYE